MTGCALRLDAPIHAAPEELAAIRAELRTIEQALSALFGADYRRDRKASVRAARPPT